MADDLFDELEQARTWTEMLAPGAIVLRRFALEWEAGIREALMQVEAAAPFRHLVTPGGYTMSVAMTNCGEWGWMSDRNGYRYQSTDPFTGRPWPTMPEVLQTMAREAAAMAGFPAFSPDACLINRYAPGARLSLHQDKNEADLRHPIVSVSLGVPATFLFGGPQRTDRPQRVPLAHGDVVVWGGPSRLHYHGVLPIKENMHAWAASHRINLTFRRAT